jgi:predicted regulator of Ras-like GTPase activity (Roadblock/LC7/MglB family)
MNLTQLVDTTLKSFRQSVPDYVGSAVVDLTTGMLLGLDTVEDQPREIVDVMGAATADLFGGRTIRQIESMWQQHGGSPDDRPALQEVLIRSNGAVVLLLRSPHDDIVTAVACRREVNIGMLLAQARQVQRELDTA